MEFCKQDSIRICDDEKFEGQEEEEEEELVEEEVEDDKAKEVEDEEEEEEDDEEQEEEDDDQSTKTSSHNSSNSSKQSSSHNYRFDSEEGYNHNEYLSSSSSSFSNSSETSQSQSGLCNKRTQSVMMEEDTSDTKCSHSKRQKIDYPLGNTYQDHAIRGSPSWYQFGSGMYPVGSDTFNVNVFSEEDEFISIMSNQNSVVQQSNMDEIQSMIAYNNN
jgi:hypothetical protein